MEYTRELYNLAPKPAELTAKQRRRIRDLLAFCHVTGHRAGGLVRRYVASTVLLYATGLERCSTEGSTDYVGLRTVVDHRALADYDVQNHPLVNLHTLLTARGFKVCDPRKRGRAQQSLRYKHEDGRTEVSISDVSSWVSVYGAPSDEVLGLVKGYASRVGCGCSDDWTDASRAKRRAEQEASA